MKKVLVCLVASTFLIFSTVYAHVQKKGAYSHKPHRQSALSRHPDSKINSLMIREEKLIGARPYGSFDVTRFKRGVSVTASPILGLKSAFDALDLLQQYPTMNEDLLLLRHRELLQYMLNQIGDSLNDRAIIVLSGGLEAQMIQSGAFAGKNNSDVNLSTSEFDVNPMISDWANGFIALSYDDSAPATGSRVINSRIYLSRGFITIGNLLVSPIYFTIGQMYAPFGKYSTVMLTTPLTKSVGRIEARAALLGFYDDGIYAEVYGFQGSKTSGTDHVFRQGGVNLGYMDDLDPWSYNIGAGVVTNIADSQGMDNNGLRPELVATPSGALTPSQFSGFAVTQNATNLVHSVPALDGHADFTVGPFTFLVEYITGLSKFARDDLRYFNAGAKIKALHLEAEFAFHILNRVVTLAFAYGQTWQLLALNLPKNSYTVVLSSSIWKDTVLGIEYRHDINYPVQRVGTVGGDGTGVTNGTIFPVPAANVGGSRNMVTVQLGAYF